jgi:hypothetical protein
MVTADTDAEGNDLDYAWASNQTPEIAPKPFVQSPLHRTPGKSYASYASAAVSDQMSGMTESDPRDVRHEELANKITTLEATIIQLCQQVQLLANASAQQKSHEGHDDESRHREKRLDRKDSPRKHKQAQTYSATSHADEGINEPAPMEDDRLTVWDDYQNHSSDD